MCSKAKGNLGEIFSVYEQTETMKFSLCRKLPLLCSTFVKLTLSVILHQNYKPFPVTSLTLNRNFKISVSYRTLVDPKGKRKAFSLLFINEIIPNFQKNKTYLQKIEMRVNSVKNILSEFNNL